LAARVPRGLVPTRGYRRHGPDGEEGDKRVQRTLRRVSIHQVYVQRTLRRVSIHQVYVQRTLRRRRCPLSEARGPAGAEDKTGLSVPPSVARRSPLPRGGRVGRDRRWPTPPLRPRRCLAEPGAGHVSRGHVCLVEPGADQHTHSPCEALVVAHRFVHARPCRCPRPGRGRGCTGCGCTHTEASSASSNPSFTWPRAWAALVDGVGCPPSLTRAWAALVERLKQEAPNIHVAWPFFSIRPSPSTGDLAGLTAASLSVTFYWGFGGAAAASLP
jgi:hypothetical protein